MIDQVMNSIYLRKYLRSNFEGTITKPLTRVEGTITKPLTRVGKHVYPIISSKYEHSVNIPYTITKKQKSFACSSHLILIR